MATINNDIPQSFATTLNKIGAKQTVMLDDLTYHLESLSDNEIVSGEIVFEPLSETQKDEVMQFYTDNKHIPFDYVYPVDGINYVLYFTGLPPMPKALVDWFPARYTISYTIIGE